MLCLRDVVLGFYSIGDVDVTQQSLACVCVCVCWGGGWGRSSSCLPHSCSFQGKETSSWLSLVQREAPQGRGHWFENCKKGFPWTSFSAHQAPSSPVVTPRQAQGWGQWGPRVQTLGRGLLLSPQCLLDPSPEQCSYKTEMLHSRTNRTGC